MQIGRYEKTRTDKHWDRAIEIARTGHVYSMAAA